MSVPAITNPDIPLNILRLIDVRVQFRWDGVNWSDETENLLSAAGAQEIAPLNEAFVGAGARIQRATVTLTNRNGKYNANNLQSPIYGHISGGRFYRRRGRIQFQPAPGAPWEDLFVGYIKQPDFEYAKNTVTFELWDLGDLLRERFSTPMITGVNLEHQSMINAKNGGGMLEHEVVIHFLKDYGKLVDYNGANMEECHYISPAAAQAYGVEPTIDYSTMMIPYTWLDDEPIWDELVDVAQAGGALMFIGKNGKVYYRKGWRWAIAPQGTNLGHGEIGDLSPHFLDKNFYDEVRVSYAPRFRGDLMTPIWELSSHRLIRPGETEEIEARFSYPAVYLHEPQEGVKYGYFIRDFSGADRSDDVTLTPTYYAQQAIFKVTNNTPTRYPGNPDKWNALVLGRFTLYGQPLLGQPSEQVKRSIPNPAERGRRIEVKENPYIQTELQASAAADFFVWWYKDSKISYTIKGLRGEGTREILQRVKLTTHVPASPYAPTTPYTTIVTDCIIVRVGWGIKVRNQDQITFSQDIEVIRDVFQVTPGYIVLDQGHTPASGRKLWL